MTVVFRVPEVLEVMLLEIAQLLDEGGDLPVTGKGAIDEAALEKAANMFLLTIPPKERLKAKRLLYGFIEKAAANVPAL